MNAGGVGLGDEGIALLHVKCLEKSDKQKKSSLNFHNCFVFSENLENR